MLPSLCKDSVEVGNLPAGTDASAAGAPGFIDYELVGQESRNAGDHPADVRAVLESLGRPAVE